MQLVTIPEIAARLGVSEGTAYTMARAREIPGVVRIGSKRLAVDLDAFLAAYGKTPSGV